MIVVVGGGWSGLAAAAELCLAGRAVTLVEAAPRLGGRAATFGWRGRTVETGQHLLIGAYRETFGLLERIGLDVTRLFERHRLVLHVHDDEADLVLAPSRLPAPLHILAGMIRAEGMTPGERLACLRQFVTMAVNAPGEDVTVADWLAAGRQPASAVRRLWNPLCLAIVNTPPERASARVFRRVLRDAFGRRRGDSDLMLPRGDLGTAFIGPIARFVSSHGGRILTGRRAVRLTAARGRATGVRLADETLLEASAVVLAVPPPALSRLLPDAGIPELPHEAVTTVYLDYPDRARLDAPMIAMTGGHVQWLLDRGYSGQPGLLAAVISGPGRHLAIDRGRLANEVIDELADRFPDWPRPRDWRVIREKRATLSCTPETQGRRPGIDDSGLAGCLIAGDAAWTAYPSTLEGAVLSGLACARRLTDNPPPGGYDPRP